MISKDCGDIQFVSYVDGNIWNVLRGRAGDWVGVCDNLHLVVREESIENVVTAAEEATTLSKKKS